MNELHNDDQALQEMLEPITDTEQVEHDDSSEKLEERIEHANPSPQESFRALREKAEREAERAERAEKRYQELMAAQEAAQRSQKESEQQYADDDIAEGRHLKKLQADYNAKLQEMGARLEQITVEARIKQQYPDFDSVVNSESVEALKKRKPGIAKIIGQTGDLYLQAEAAYDLIKTYGLTPNPQVEVARTRAENNLRKPHLGPSAPPASKSPGTFDFADRIMSGEMTPEMEQYLRDEIEKNSRKLY